MDVTSLFNPSSIAVVGASRKPHKIGHIVLKNIQEGGYKGKIFAVNPKGEIIRNLQTYTSYESIPFTPELAILCIPSDIVLKEIPKIAKKGTKNILIYSAGFKEIGGSGKQKEEKLIQMSKKLSLKILGPNCLGFVNNTIRLNATFSHSGHSQGNLSFISQSGAIASALFDWFDYTGIGFEQFITIGNKACIGENDILQYLSRKTTTNELQIGYSNVKPIGMYLESIQNGSELFNILSSITPTRPVFILKPGKSKSAQKAMQSHTGSIAGEDAVFDAAMKQAGVIRCEGIEDFFDLAKGFAWENAPDGPEIGIISNAGGPAVMSADFVHEYGLKLATLSPDTLKRLEKFLPRTASIINPIDVLGDALVDRYENALRAVLEDKSVNGVIILLTPQIMTEIEKTAEIIGTCSREYQIPIICSFIGGNSISTAENILNSYKIPNFRYPERAIKVLSMMWNWKKSAKKITMRRRRFKTYSLNYFQHVALSQLESIYEAKKIGLDVPPFERVTPNITNIDIKTNLEFPVVLKISSPELLHKTEIGGVITHINSLTELIKSYERLSSVVLSKNIQKADLVIQQFIKDGIELIIGCKRDLYFGPLLTIGAGGILTELIQDHKLVLIPTSQQNILEALHSLRVYSLIKGFRNQQKYNEKGLLETISKLIDYFINHPEISEIEINPLILTKQKAYAADIKIIVVH